MGLIALVVTFAVSWMGYGTARRFVRERLRYVESALKPSAAIIAGVGAFVLAGAAVWLITLLPFVHYLIPGGTALVFGASVGLGVRSGANDVKRGYVITSGS
jgi:hypothetical protein